MLIQRSTWEVQPSTATYKSTAIPPTFLWNANTPHLNLMDGAACTVRSDATKGYRVSPVVGATTVIVPADTNDPLILPSFPAGDSKGFAFLVVVARNANADDIVIVSSADNGTRLIWGWQNLFRISTTYVGATAASIGTTNFVNTYTVVFGKTTSGRYFLSVDGMIATNGYLDGTSANHGTIAGSWLVRGKQTSSNYPMLASMAFWHSTPANIVSAEYAMNPWKLFGTVDKPHLLYQPADSVLVPPVLSAPGMTNVTATTGTPNVRVEY